MWCIKCRYGSHDAVIKQCGYCGSKDITGSDPFAEARKNPRTLRDTRKDKKNEKKGKQTASSITKDVEQITKSKLIRDYSNL